MKRAKSHVSDATSEGLRHGLPGRRASPLDLTPHGYNPLPSQQAYGFSQAPMLSSSESGQWLSSQYISVSSPPSLSPSQCNLLGYQQAAQQLYSTPYLAEPNGPSRYVTDNGTSRNYSNISDVSSLREPSSQEWSFISGERLRRDIECDSVWAATENSHGENFGHDSYMGVHQGHIGQGIMNPPDLFPELVSGIGGTGAYSCNSPYEASCLQSRRSTLVYL